MPVTTIKITNVFTKQYGEQMKKKLEELTKDNYHNFEYGLCPVGGSFDLIVSTMYEFESDDPEKELLELFVFILSEEIIQYI